MSELIGREPGEEPNNLPPDSDVTPEADESPYLDKEVNIIPLDFGFRYAHHDYQCLTTYRGRLGQCVLHLGCNAGINALILAREGLRVHGVDIQARAIAVARQLRDREPPSVAARVTYQRASFLNMQLPDGVFDSAFAFDVLEHIHADDLPHVLQRVSCALKPGGYLLVHVPLGRSFWDPAHVNLFTPEYAREAMGRVFNVVRCYVTSDDGSPDHRRVNVLAQKPLTISPGRPPRALRLHVSDFYTERYTHDRATVLVHALQEATDGRKPFSLVRLSDAEVRLLAFERVDLGYADWPTEALTLEQHLGVNPQTLGPMRLAEVRDELVSASLDADVLGTHRQTVNRRWSEDAERVLPLYGLARHANEVDLVFNAELLDQGFLLPLLADTRVLLVGNAAPRLAELLRDDTFRASYASIGMPTTVPAIAGVVFVPHVGTEAIDALEDLWSQIVRLDFDLALIGASVCGKILAGRIKRQLGAVALDIGWSMQYLADMPSPVAASRDARRRGFRHLFQGRLA